MESNKRILYIVIFGILLIASVFFGLQYFMLSQELAKANIDQNRTELNNRVIDFTSMFITKVLQAEQEVDFETRLSLENAVRGLKDEEIMSEWQTFVGSKTEAEAQQSVKDLLGILVSKIRK